MNKKTAAMMPKTQKILQTMGNQIRMARLRRNISVDLVAERAGVSRATVWNIEKGSPNVAIGYYAVVLHAIDNMDSELLKVFGDDVIGREIQDFELLKKGNRK